MNIKFNPLISLINSHSLRSPLRQMASNKASLILVDRTLDVTSAAGHNADSLLDRILRTLPRLSAGRHHVDVAVDMSSLSSTHPLGRYNMSNPTTLVLSV